MANSSGGFKKSTDALHKEERLQFTRDLQVENEES